MSNLFAAATKVLMVNFYSADYTVQAVKSLAKFGFVNVSIWSNGDSDAGLLTLEQLRLENPDIELLVSDKNIGFGSAVNELVAQDKDAADVYWILNPDCLVVGADLSEVENWRRDQNRKTVLCPLIVSGVSETFVWFAGGELNQKTRQAEHIGYGLDQSALVPNQESFSFLSGASFFIKRNHFLEIGGFDSSIFLYFEDVDFSIRATRAGLELLLDPSIVVWHKEGGSNRTNSSKSSSYYFHTNMNRIIVFSRHFGFSGWLRPSTLIATLRNILLPLKEPVRKYYVVYSAAGVVAGFARFLTHRVGHSK
jgi:GT2 family glycosyltransferase